ncbi:MAG TPA: DUF4394 domain-containing protein [Oculatellaceae cyanobacterium]|jgi:hypothetical protein
MKLNKIYSLASALAVATILNQLGIINSANAATIRLTGLTDNNTLVSFKPESPNSIASVGVTGLNGNLLGIDFRPANQMLYGVTDTNNIYTINPTTGAATFVSTLSPTLFTAGQQSGFDFNPVPDRLRLVGNNDQNLRINVDTGAVIVDGTLAYAATDANAGANPNITAAAYTNSFAGTTTTQLFNIDSNLDILVQQNPPNNGTLNTIGSLGIDFGSTGGFDIFTGSDQTTNTAFAASGSSLYNINLATGAATTLGTIGNNVNIVGLAATSVPESSNTNSLLGFGVFGLAFGLFSRYSRRVKLVN